ncbi:MAG: hypothetical protein M5R41_11760 [Bacteroidia bacterium]|nr:hypothetical protein [Bacteroidia bacterium]
MKYTMMHDILSWTIEKDDTLQPASQDRGSHIHRSPFQTAAPPAGLRIAGHQYSARFLAGLAMLLSVVLLLACDDNPPDAPVDPVLPPTIDTTSHDFVWTVDTIGMELSWINDVAIISENDVWVVGMFEQRGDDGRYDITKRGNAAHFDGKKWTIYNITDGTRGWGGEKRVVCAAGPGNIWMMSGGGWHFDGSRWRSLDFWSLGHKVSTLDAWVSDDLNTRIFVGPDSSLVYFKDGAYVKHLSAPGYDFNAVDGFSNGDALIGAGKFNVGALFRMNREGGFSTVLKLSKYEIEDVSVTIHDDIVFTTRRNLYRCYGDRAIAMFETDQNIYGLKANTVNDIFIGTGSSTIYHYNGIDVKDIGPDYSGICYGMGLTATKDLVYFIAIGEMQRCLVFRGERKK